MMSSKILATKAVAATLLIAAAGAAQAASTSQTLSWTGGVLNWQQSQSFAQFSVAGATLDSVELSFTGSYDSAVFSVTNNGAASSTFKGSAQVEYLLYQGTVDAIDEYNGGNYDFVFDESGVAANLGPISIGAGQTKTKTYAADSVAWGYTYTGTELNDLLSFFQGAGSASYSLGGMSSFTSTSTGSFTQTYSPNAVGELVITYNYTVTPVPEPESYAMLLAGLAAIGVVARRRRVQG